MPDTRTIDPRGPRFAAGITALLLAVTVVLGLTGLSAAREFWWIALGSDAPDGSFGWFAYQPLAGVSHVSDTWAVSAVPITVRLLDPGFLLLAAVALLFVWGVALPRTAPWGVIYRRLVQPRLAPPTEREDPRPPRFAQGVGLVVTALGVVLHLAGVPLAVPIAAGIAFVAAFLNAAFGLCLGCHLWLLLQRAGLVGRPRLA